MSNKPRMIDADIAKQEIAETFLGNSEFAKDIRDACYRALDNVPTIDAVPQWIPVTERLPEHSGRYIAFSSWWTPKNTCRTWIDLQDFDKRLDSFCTTHVLAWMPLPEPYEVKVDGKDGDGE